MIRTRRTREEIEVMESAILEILEKEHPSIARTIFYMLVVKGLVAKTDAGYKQVIDRLGRMRTGGRLPYSWIVDATRLGYHVPAYSSIVDFQHRVSAFYRSDVWANVPEHVEVWCESRSLAGMLRPLCHELGVSLYPCGGFSSLSLEYSAAQDMANTGKEKAVVLYLGDYDPGGETISDSLQKKLGEHLEEHGMELDFQRLAVTKAQVDRYNLPTRPRKAGEKRKPDIIETTEAEALPPANLRAIVQRAAQRYLPAQALHAAKIADASERKVIARLGRGAA